MTGPERSVAVEPPERAGQPAAGSGRGVLEGAFELLNVLARSETAGLSELARATDLPKTTVYRLLTQLTELGMVERDELSCYRVGSGLRRMVGPERPFRWLHRAGRGPITRLSSMIGASVGLTVRDGSRLIAVSAVVPERGLAYEAGMSVPLSTAGGQILLAESDELPPPPIYSDHEWRRVRATIRRQGIAFDRGDIVDGICCVAAPVRGADGRVVASLAAVIVADAVQPRLVDLVRRAADEATRGLAGSLGAPELSPLGHRH